MVTAIELIGRDQSLQEHWVKRFVALVIDSVIFWVIAVVLGLFFSVRYYWWLGWPLIYGIFLFFYATLMELSSGATLGKKLMDLRVISITGPMDIGKAVVRNIPKIYWLFLLIDWLVGFVTEGDPKQKLLDRYAGTTVVLTDRLTDEEQHIYQTQQSKYAPPPPEQYATQEEPVYQYPQPPPPPSTAPQQQADAPQGQVCSHCGGRQIPTGSGRLQCIRCGKIT